MCRPMGPCRSTRSTSTSLSITTSNSSPAWLLLLEGLGRGRGRGLGLGQGSRSQEHTATRWQLAASMGVLATSPHSRGRPTQSPLGPMPCSLASRPTTSPGSSLGSRQHALWWCLLLGTAVEVAPPLSAAMAAAAWVAGSSQSR